MIADEVCLLCLGMLVTPDFFIAKKRSTMQDFFTTTSCRSNASAALPVTTGIWHLPLRGVAVFRESPVHAPAWCSKLKEELQRWGNKFSRELFHLQYFLWCFCSLMCFSSLFLYLLLPFVRYQSNLEHAWSGGCHRMWAWGDGQKHLFNLYLSSPLSINIYILMYLAIHTALLLVGISLGRFDLRTSTSPMSFGQRRPVCQLSDLELTRAAAKFGRAT